MKEVTLKIIGKQTTKDGQEDSVEIMTKGKFYEKNDSKYLVYEETELSGMEGSTTTLKIEKNKITMKRFGTNSSSLVFEKAKIHKTNYQTPYGNFDMKVQASKLEVELDENDKGKIEINYRLSISGVADTKNSLYITIF